MRTKVVAVLLVLISLLLVGFACSGGGGGGETIPTVPSTPTGQPTITPTACEIDRDAIQAALYAYHDQKGEWPSADGISGDIVWEKLVPGFLAETPETDEKCDWQVNTKPEGELCLWEQC